MRVASTGSKAVLAAGVIVTAGLWTIDEAVGKGADDRSPVLSLRAAVRFAAEKPGDGAPKIHYAFTFKNLTGRDVLINVYDLRSLVRLRSVEPTELFRQYHVQGYVRETRKMPPSKRSDVLRLAAGQQRTVSWWEWFSNSFAVHRGTQANPYVGPVAFYSMTRAGKVKLRYCFLPWGGRDAEVARFLPKGQRFFAGTEICAPTVEVNVQTLPSVQ